MECQIDYLILRVLSKYGNLIPKLCLLGTICLLNKHCAAFKHWFAVISLKANNSHLFLIKNIIATEQT